MSVSPAQNFSKPPPVPDWPTVTWTLGCSSLKSSPAASAKGKTVEEPSIRIVPESSSLIPRRRTRCRRRRSSSSPQAATPSASAAASAANTGMNRFLLMDPSFSV